MLNFLLIIVLALVFILLWILLIPLRIIIDSPQHIYKAELGSLGYVSFLPNFENSIIRLQILWWKKDFLLSAIESAPKEKKPRKKKKLNLRFSKIKRKAIRVLKSFKVQLFDLRLDTDDYYYNAMLYPLFFFLNGRKARWSINFNGEVSLRLIIHNRLIKILYAIIK